jgi:single-strand DNA-binding protein
MANITIWGRIGADAVIRSTQGGDTVCSFNVAQDQREGREKTTAWYRCSLWGKRADSLAPYLLKGALVTVSGSLTLTEYEGKLQANLRVNDVALQGGRSGGTDAPAEPQRNSRQMPADDLDDSIPFASNRSIW